jgi:hypothetical protein
VSSGLSFISLSKPYKPVGGFAYYFEQILSKAKRGILPEESIQYFMIYAKRVYQKAEYRERATELSNLLEEWNYWISLKKKLQQKDYELPVLLEYERIAKLSLEHINLSSEDLKVRILSLDNQKVFQEYVTSLVDMRIEELFFTILSKICIAIYADNLLNPAEISRLIQNTKRVNSKRDNSNTFGRIRN